MKTLQQELKERKMVADSLCHCGCDRCVRTDSHVKHKRPHDLTQQKEETQPKQKIEKIEFDWTVNDTKPISKIMIIEDKLNEIISHLELLEEGK